MEQIIITKPNGSTYPLASKRTATEIKSAKQSWALLADDVVSISIESPFPQTYGIGDHFTVFGRAYKLNRLPKVKKTGMHAFSYDLEFEGIQYDLIRATYDLTIDTTNNQLQDVQADTLTGNLRRFSTVLISNANRVFPNTWVLGSCPDTIEDKTLTFGEGDNCLSVLQTLCTEFGVEFEIVQSNGKFTINFVSKVGQIFPFTFEFGKGKGLYSLDRQNVDSSNIITRLKVYGSTSNITNKYRASRLCLPGKSKAQSYIEKPEAVAKYGIYESTKYFDDIKPTFNGSITGLVSGAVLKFIDTKMFDLNALEADGKTTKYLIEGCAAKVHFNTGNLAGYEFEVHAYDHATKTFTLVKQTDDRGDVFPSESSSAFQFTQGNEYKLLDIALPDIPYQNDAESKLNEQGNIYYDQNSQPKVQYGLSVTKAYLKTLVGNGTTVNIFAPGDYIPVKDSDIDVDKSVRIKSLTRNLLDEYEYTLTISDTVSTNITNRVISELVDIDKIITINNLKDPVRARANWRSSREVLNMVFDPEGDYYTDKIKPNSIDTLSLSVGAKSMQFGLTNTVLQPNFNGNKNTIKVKGGVLTHYTINEESARSWVLADNTTTFPKDTQAYYIYAKCAKVGEAGSIIFSTEQIKVEQDAMFYHFWIGIVNSVDAELKARSVALSYGFTMINGRFIKTGRIESADGLTYFDLDKGEIGGKLTFISNTGSSVDMADYSDGVSSDILETQRLANEAKLEVQEAQSYIDNTLPAVLESLQSQIDGQIESFFYEYDPTTSNYPASSWVTTQDKEKHLNDTFTNNKTGASWRWIKSGTVYSWQIIADTATSEALRLAGLAKDTADNKRRVFVSTPYPPYEVGDLWAQGASGDLMRCKTARLSGSYVVSDWDKSSKYTDDTKAIEALGIANTAKTTAETANKSVSDLNTYVNGAFADGLIDEAEAKQIAEQLKNINESKVTADSSYTALYNNALLDGTAKTNLASAKSDLDSKRTSLINSINAIVSNGKVTTALRTAYTNAYTAYATSYGTFSTRMQEATRTIETNAVNKGVETLRKRVVIDASALDQDTYYAVTTQISATETTSIEVNVALDSGTKPSWSTHVHGFSCRFEETVNGSGWGTSHVNRVVRVSDYIFATHNPIGNVTQLTNSSTEVIYVRGGGKYFFFTSNNATPILRTDSYTVSSQTVNPIPLANVDFVTNKTSLTEKADKAQSAINAMNDDSIFDVVEKQSIRTQWEAIQGAADLSGENQSGSFYKARTAGISNSVSITALTTAYSNLKSFLNTWGLYTNSNSSAGFSRSSMANVFKLYYNEEIEVYDKISKGYVDKLEIGGTNILDQSEMKSNYGLFKPNQQVIVSNPNSEYTRVVFNQSISTPGITINPFPFEVGETYTISFVSRYSGGGSFRLHNGLGGIDLNRYSDFTRQSVTFTATSTAPYLMFYSYNMQIGDYFDIKNIKVEQGNKATAWTPSEQDTYNKTNTLSQKGIPTKGLVAYFPLDGNHTDLWGNAPATQNNVSYYEDTEQGVVGSFNGVNSVINTGISFQTNPMLSSTKEISLTATVYPQEWINYKGIMGAYSGSVGIIFGTYDIGNMLYFGASTLSAEQIKISPSIVALNTFTTITLVAKVGQKLRLYINGIFYIESNIPITTISKHTSFWIGRAYPASDRFFKGYISNVSIHNRVLSDNEVYNLSQKTLSYISKNFAQATQGQTIIEGGLQLLNTIGLRDKNNLIRFLLTGLMEGTQQDYAFASGIPDNQDISQAKTRLMMNGNWFCENADIRGNIHAKSGNFGGMSIGADGIYNIGSNCQFLNNELEPYGTVILKGLRPTCNANVITRTAGGSSASGQQVYLHTQLSRATNLFYTGKTFYEGSYSIKVRLIASDIRNTTNYEFSFNSDSYVQGNVKKDFIINGSYYEKVITLYYNKSETYTYYPSGAFYVFDDVDYQVRTILVGFDHCVGSSTINIIASDGVCFYSRIASANKIIAGKSVTHAYSIYYQKGAFIVNKIGYIYYDGSHKDLGVDAGFVHGFDVNGIPNLKMAVCKGSIRPSASDPTSWGVVYRDNSGYLKTL